MLDGPKGLTNLPHLCVGGPYDGQMHSSQSIYITLAIFDTPEFCIPPKDVSNSDLPFTAAFYKTFVYAPSPIITGDETVWFWVPEGTTSLEIINALVVNYKPDRIS